MTKWTYITTAKDAPDSLIYDGTEYITHDPLALFDSKEDAYSAAVHYAEEECDSLNESCDDRLFFGVPEDDLYNSMDEVKVYCYDENNDTELVTRRSIRSVRS